MAAILAKEITPVTIENELKQSYLDYSMSVIVGRALPDVKDGLKPVHRRVLYAMHELGNDWNKPYKKSARVVGDVIGKYHPHGETAVYDALVRMAQPFTFRAMLIDGQGNFGSIDGDPPAAMRYTEVRMNRITHSLIADLDKDTVDFTLNYDETESYPTVLPTRVPNLLVNGSSGIAVGMATNIPTHNLAEVIDACLAWIENPNLTVNELMEYIPGPDFPTAAIINGRAGIVDAYKTGRGKIQIRARCDIEETKHSANIIVKELPYQVNKARLIEKIAELVKEKRIEGITGLRDESDKDGMRVVIELRRGEIPEVVLNNLFIYTQLQTVFGINMVALVDGQPKVLNLPQIIECFIKHRREVVTRRTKYELQKARERAHILEGLGVALVNIDAVIAMIKSSTSAATAKEKLISNAWEPGVISKMLAKAGAVNCRPPRLADTYGLKGATYSLSPEQAQAILDLKLHRLTGLEQDKIMEEFQSIIEKINMLLEILIDSKQLLAVVTSELEQVKAEFQDIRRTEIISNQQDLNKEDLIPEEDMVVTLSAGGYIKSQPLSLYQSQRRGGRGKTATTVKDEDVINNIKIACTHDTLLCFSNKGKVYWLKVYEIPTASRTSKGKPIVNLLPLANDESINAVLNIRNFSTSHSIFLATVQGVVKKVALTEFQRPRASGIIAIDLANDDILIGAELTEAKGEIILSSDAGKAIRFRADDVRCMGRGARGVRGIRLAPGQKVISLIVLKPTGTILTVTENGYGKRTTLDEFSIIGRGGQGVIAIQTSSRNGAVVGAIQVSETDEVLLISSQGTMVRIKASDISIVGRNTQGVTLINLSDGEELVGIQAVCEIDDAGSEENAAEEDIDTK